MASITKRNNTYTIRVSMGYDGAGKQIQKFMTWKPDKGMTEKQIAKELERQKVLFEERCLNGQYMDGNIKFSEFAEYWFNEYAKKQLKRRTIAEYERLLVRINTALGHMRISKIQPRHLMELYNNLAEKGVRKDIKYKSALDLAEYMKKHNITNISLAERTGLSRNTIMCCKRGDNVSANSAIKVMEALGNPQLFAPVDENKTLSSTTIAKYHTLLSSIFSAAVKWQMLFSNPCGRVQAPKKVRSEAKYIDDIQAVELISCLDAEPLKYRSIIMLLLYSGMRRGELCGLEWSDVDFNNCIISITKTNLYISGLGIFEDTTKNKTSQRVIKVPQEVIQLLREYKTEQSKQRIMIGDRWQGSKKIFTTDEGKPIHPDTISGWFNKFLERHSLPHISIHSLRHTNATLLIASGTNLRTVSQRLGHANTSTTVNIYTHAIQSADERASAALNDILSAHKAQAN